jgi:hypothetical protein
MVIVDLLINPCSFYLFSFSEFVDWTVHLYQPLTIALRIFDLVPLIWQRPPGTDESLLDSHSPDDP